MSDKSKMIIVKKEYVKEKKFLKVLINNGCISQKRYNEILNEIKHKLLCEYDLSKSYLSML